MRTIPNRLSDVFIGTDSSQFVEKLPLFRTESFEMELHQKLTTYVVLVNQLQLVTTRMTSE